MKKQMWFASGSMMALTAISLSLGGVPELGRVTDDTVLHQNLSEIRAQKQRDLNFDPDIHRLSAIEKRYAEKLPELSPVRGPMARISSQKYRASAPKKRARASLSR